MTNRRAVREAVLQALYSFEVGQNDSKDVIKHIIKPQLSEDKDGLKFAEKLFLRTLDQRDAADEIITAHINNWEIGRLAMLDKQILRLALCEFLQFDDIPTKVTINEAIEIAKKFSTQKSGKFVNGILDGALAQLTKEGKIKKKGRGLIESTQK
jgi:N utilization substance protein B